MNLVVPLIFWDDHKDRSPCDDDKLAHLQICSEVRRTKKEAYIHCTDAQLANFRSDAEHYASWPKREIGEYGCPRRLYNSAVATVAALNRQGVA